MKTPEQEKYVSELLKNKNVPKRTYRRRRVTPLFTETKKTDYMRNCVQWIDEYIEGRCDIVRLNGALNALQNHLNEIREKYLNK